MNEEIKEGDVVEHKISKRKYIVLKIKEGSNFGDAMKELLSGEPSKDLFCKNCDPKAEKKYGHLHRAEVRRVK